MVEQIKHYSASEIENILNRVGSIYFIGIGGVSMSSLARICHKLGAKVCGSDRASSTLTDELISQGIGVRIGHSDKELEGFGAFVYNAAIHSDNPEFAYAVKNNIPLIYRSDLLGYIVSKYKTSVGISGTHGKSTTTAMVSAVLTAADLDPTVLNGAKMAQTGECYREGCDNVLAFEACEYMDSFLSFFPTISVVLNCELDHVDYFKSFENYIRSFRKYIDRSGECAVVNNDCTGVVEVIKDVHKRLITYGIKNSSDVMAENISIIDSLPEYDITVNGMHYCHVRLGVNGEHNIYDSLAAASVAYELGVDGKAVADALLTFRGAERRFEYKKSVNGAKVYDDYAHHPTEIRATVSSARQICKGKLYCVFQSHTYSRTKGLFDQFITAFEGCDEIIFADIYPARETDTLGMSAELLADCTKNGKYKGDFSKIAEYVKNTAGEGDIVIIMGAGDVNKITSML